MLRKEIWNCIWGISIHYEEKIDTSRLKIQQRFCKMEGFSGFFGVQPCVHVVCVTQVWMSPGEMRGFPIFVQVHIEKLWQMSTACDIYKPNTNDGRKVTETKQINKRKTTQLGSRVCDWLINSCLYKSKSFERFLMWLNTLVMWILARDETKQIWQNLLLKTSLKAWFTN